LDPDPLSGLFYPVFLSAQPDGFAILGALLLLALLFVSALVSGSEIAFFSFQPADISDLEQANDRKSKRMLNLIRAPRLLLATILITNNLVNVAIVVLSELYLRRVLPQERMQQWAYYIIDRLQWNLTVWQVVEALNFAIAVIGVTFILVLVGEVMPKVLAYADYKKFARRMTPLLHLLRKLFYGPALLLVRWGHAIEKRLATQISNNDISKEDIDKAIDLTTHGTTAAEEEAGLLKSIVKFGDITVKEIMQPRIDIKALDWDMAYDEVLDLIKETGFSRFPVFKENIDNIHGMLYVKDLIGFFREKPGFKWQNLVRKEVKYVPDSKLIVDLLKEFKIERVHMAIVIDEYGATEGLVTLEDIMEEVVGDIQDEFDEDEDVDYRKINDYIYVFDGKTLISEFCKIVNIDPDYFDNVRDEADSLAGMILEVNGDFPKKGTEIEIKGFKFKVLSMGKRRIGEIRVTLPHQGKEKTSAA